MMIQCVALMLFLQLHSIPQKSVQTSNDWFLHNRGQREELYTSTSNKCSFFFLVRNEERKQVLVFSFSLLFIISLLYFLHECLRFTHRFALAFLRNRSRSHYFRET